MKTAIILCRASQESRATQGPDSAYPTGRKAPFARLGIFSEKKERKLVPDLAIDSKSGNLQIM